MSTSMFYYKLKRLHKPDKIPHNPDPKYTLKSFAQKQEQNDMQNKTCQQNRESKTLFIRGKYKSHKQLFVCGMQLLQSTKTIYIYIYSLLMSIWANAQVTKLKEAQLVNLEEWFNFEATFQQDALRAVDACL